MRLPFLFQKHFLCVIWSIILITITLTCQHAFSQQCHNLDRNSDTANMGSFTSQATTESKDIIEKALIIANERAKRANSPGQVTLLDITLALVTTIKVESPTLSLTIDTNQGTLVAILKKMDDKLGQFTFAIWEYVRANTDIDRLNITNGNERELVLELNDNPYESIDLTNVILTEEAHLLLAKAEEAKNEENAYRQNTEHRNNFSNSHISPEHILLAFIDLPFSNPIRDFFFTHYTNPPTLRERWLGGLFGRFSPDIRQAIEVNGKLYQAIGEVRGPNNRNGVREESPQYQLVEYVSFHPQTQQQQQNRASQSNIPFTSRITRSLNRYPLNPSLYKSLATDLLNPEFSRSIVITGPIGSGRHSLGSLVIDEVLQTQNSRIESIETMQLEYRQGENERGDGESSNTINIEVLYFDPSKMVTEGETKYVGVIPTNIRSFIESIERSLSQDKDNMIILHISYTPLNTLLNLGKTDNEDGTQLRDGLIRLMEQYEGQLKILGYTESTAHRMFMDSPLGNHFRQVVKDPPNMEEMSTVLKFLVEERIKKSHTGPISDQEKAMIIEGILYLYQTYNTHRLSYFRQLQVVTDTIFQEVQTIKEERQKGGEPDIISEGQLDVIISRSFLSDQPFRTYSGNQRYRNRDDFVQHIEETVLQEKGLITNIAGNILFSSYKTSTNTDDNARPFSITVLGGPSGTGKTILVRAIARWLFPHLSEPYSHIDGNQNQTALTLTKIIGEPNNPFKIEDTHADNASLTGYVRQHPHALIYVNEFHRLSEPVKNTLESIWENGKIEDAKGRIVSFEQTHWILDFNPVNPHNPSQIEASSKETLIEWLTSNNSQSFVDRLNKQMIFFIPELNETQLADIARLMIANRNWIVEDDAVYTILARNNEGARDIRDHIEILGIERQRQRTHYIDETGLVPSNLQTKLTVENDEVRITVERTNNQQPTSSNSGNVNMINLFSRENLTRESE